METLVDMMIVSEVWWEDGTVHIVAWVPDLVEGKPRYRLKHIIYDTEQKRLLRVEDEETPAAGAAATLPA